MKRSIGIVGAGAGGMMTAIAACHAAHERSLDVEVHLYERNPRPGIKILISGGGKCNVTHAGPVEEVLREGFLVAAEQRFLKSAMYRYTNDDVLAMLERYGVAWHTRENGRIFPDSSRAEDVLRTFEREMKAAGVMLHTRAHVTGIARESDAWILEINGAPVRHDALVLATGGTSYRKVGTTGDGIRYAESLGHTIVPIRAALAPIYLWRPPVQELVGTALRNVELYVVQNEKIVARHTGDVLLTHKGISGPATLDISREAALAAENSEIVMQVNLLSTSEDNARAKLIAEQRTRQQQLVKTWLEELLPNKFAPFVLSQAGIELDRRWHALTREERAKLERAITRYDLGRVREIPIDRGEVTAGGVSLKEVDAKTMMSRRSSGLFFAGEMLDIAGEIGGYNLQAAYSTGYVAGEEAVEFVSRTVESSETNTTQ